MRIFYCLEFGFFVGRRAACEPFKSFAFHMMNYFDIIYIIKHIDNISLRIFIYSLCCAHFCHCHQMNLFLSEPNFDHYSLHLSALFKFEKNRNVLTIQHTSERQCFARCDDPTISWNGLIHAATHLYSQSITFDTNDNYWNRSNILRTLLQMIFGVNIFNEHERNDIECHQGRRKNQFPFYERSNFGWLFVRSHSLPIEIDRTNERNKCMPHVQNISPHTFTYIKLNSIPLCNSF